MTPFSVVEGPEAWKAADYQDLSKFMYVFSDSDIAELDSAIAAVQARGLDIKVRLQRCTHCNSGTQFAQLPLRRQECLRTSLMWSNGPKGCRGRTVRRA